MLNMKYFKLIAIAALIIFTARSSMFALWNILDIGMGVSAMYGITIGSVRNDGVNRIYASNANTHMVEFTYAGSSWNSIDIGQNSAGAVMNCLVTGNGRNDGVTRLYASAANNQIYEYSYSSTPLPNGSWNAVSIGIGNTSPVNGMLGVALGNGRNDGVTRVYASCDDGHLYEFTYSGGTWSKVDMGFGGASSAMNKLMLANGRNDGIIRVYAANNDGHLYEFTYSGSGNVWNINDMGYNGSYMRCVAFGNARNDGVNRIYGANADGRPFEYEYSATASTWTYFCVDNAVMTHSVNWLEGVTVTTGRNDGITRLYGSDYDSHVYEYSYGFSNGISTFTKFDMGFSGSNMYAITSGNARNDGLMRVYAANASYHIYEFSYTTSTLLADNQSNSAITNAIVYPTFANLSKGDNIRFANFTPRAEILILTLAGHVIKTFHADATGKVATWDGTIDNGGKAASGTYIIHASDNLGGYKIFKILLIK